MKNTRFFIILLFSIILFATPIFAQDDIIDPGLEPVENIVNIIVDFLALLFLAFAFLAAWSVYTNYREGQLSTPWGLIAGGVALFFFGRILQAGDTSNLWEMPMIIKSFLDLIVSLALLLGMVLYKKTIT